MMLCRNCSVAPSLLLLYCAAAVVVGVSSTRMFPPVRHQQSGFVCGADFGHYPHATNCSLYFVCLFGEPIEKSCTPPLVYSEQLETCDWPRNVRGCHGDYTTRYVADEYDRLIPRSKATSIIDSETTFRHLAPPALTSPSFKSVEAYSPVNQFSVSRVETPVTSVELDGEEEEQQEEEEEPEGAHLGRLRGRQRTGSVLSSRVRLLEATGDTDYSDSPHYRGRHQPQSHNLFETADKVVARRHQKLLRTSVNSHYTGLHDKFRSPRMRWPSIKSRERSSANQVTLSSLSPYRALTLSALRAPEPPAPATFVTAPHHGANFAGQRAAFVSLSSTTAAAPVVQRVRVTGHSPVTTDTGHRRLPAPATAPASASPAAVALVSSHGTSGHNPAPAQSALGAGPGWLRQGATGTSSSTSFTHRPQPAATAATDSPVASKVDAPSGQQRPTVPFSAPSARGAPYLALYNDTIYDIYYVYDEDDLEYDDYGQVAKQSTTPTPTATTSATSPPDSRRVPQYQPFSNTDRSALSEKQHTAHRSGYYDRPSARPSPVSLISDWIPMAPPSFRLTPPTKPSYQDDYTRYIIRTEEKEKPLQRQLQASGQSKRPGETQARSPVSLLNTRSSPRPLADHEEVPSAISLEVSSTTDTSLSPVLDKDNQDVGRASVDTDERIEQTTLVSTSLITPMRGQTVDEEIRGATENRRPSSARQPSPDHKRPQSLTPDTALAANETTTYHPVFVVTSSSSTPASTPAATLAATSAATSAATPAATPSRLQSTSAVTERGSGKIRRRPSKRRPLRPRYKSKLRHRPFINRTMATFGLKSILHSKNNRNSIVKDAADDNDRKQDTYNDDDDDNDDESDQFTDEDSDSDVEDDEVNYRNSDGVLSMEKSRFMKAARTATRISKLFPSMTRTSLTDGQSSVRTNAELDDSELPAVESTVKELPETATPNSRVVSDLPLRSVKDDLAKDKLARTKTTPVTLVWPGSKPAHDRDRSYLIYNLIGNELEEDDGDSGVDNSTSAVDVVPLPAVLQSGQRSLDIMSTVRIASLFPKKSLNSKTDISEKDKGIWEYPPKRPEPVFKQPEVNQPATQCSASQCRLPDCYCGGTTIPGGLKADQTPQLVLLTFDDSINELNRELYEEIFGAGGGGGGGRVNANGCPISATFFVSHEWTDYGLVRNMYADGHEIASHTISHSHGENFSEAKWEAEIEGQREILATYGGVRMEDIRGMRAPFLSIGGNKMYHMLYKNNFTYDSSMPVYDNVPPLWPFTLDYHIRHECMIRPCPDRSYPGVWQLPMVMWEDLNGGRCNMVDACARPDTAEQVFELHMQNFNRHYNSNRAVFPLFFHSAWFNMPHLRKGFMAFLDHITSRRDVWLVTAWQAIQWMRHPQSLNTVEHFEPFGCQSEARVGRCETPRRCKLPHGTGVRYMSTCQGCPSRYPWVGDTGVTRP